MNARLPASLLPPFSATTSDDGGPDIGMLDFLGRMPIPLRRPFKAGLDRAVADHRAATGHKLACCFLSGAEWYRPFDGLTVAAASAGDLPAMLVSHFSHDILTPELVARYTPNEMPAIAMHPAAIDAGLADPLGIFRTFAAIPFVFLVDEMRLKGRPVPRTWSDLLDPAWAGEIVFGGWRPNGCVPYQDYNSYLLLALYLEFGADGLRAFAGNVKHLQHNIRTAVQVGSNASSVGAIAILPWLQAELCPRRERTRVIWPEDGALTTPIGYMVRNDAGSQVDPLVDFVTGRELGQMLVRNCYPPTGAGISGAFPDGARLKWPGWEVLRGIDLTATSREAASHFFLSWHDEVLERACG